MQRKLGLELELPVPIDKAGKLSKNDRRILAGKKTDPKRLQEIRQAADAGYGEFHNPSGLGWAFHADHSSRVLPEDPDRFPIRVLGKSILEIVFDPPVETEKGLTKTLAEIGEILQAIGDLTDGLKKRADFVVGGIHMGPVDGETKPPQLGYEAMIHVNLGIDIRQFAQYVDWYARSEYAPKREHFTTSFTEATEIADLATRHFVEKSGLERKDVQDFNGLRGLTALYILYLKSGENESELRSSVKNFTAILLKTRFSEIIENGLTPAELKFLKEQWRKYKEVLLYAARGEEARLADILIKRTKPDKSTKTYKDPSWKVSDIFKTGKGSPPPLVAKTIGATEVGPVRSPSDQVTGGGRRKAPVFEFRSLPGRYKPEAWEKIGKDFLRKADELNAVRDYKEPKPIRKKKPSRKSRVEEVEKKREERSRRILTQPLPDLPVQKPVEVSASVVRVGQVQEVSQRNQFWTVDQTVSWNDATWTVLARLGVNKYRLKRVA